MARSIDKGSEGVDQQRDRQAMDMAEEIDQLRNENARLRHENADLLGRLDAFEFAYNALQAENGQMKRKLAETSLDELVKEAQERGEY